MIKHVKNMRSLPHICEKNQKMIIGNICFEIMVKVYRQTAAMSRARRGKY